MSGRQWSRVRNMPAIRARVPEKSSPRKLVSVVLMALAQRGSCPSPSCFPLGSTFRTYPTALTVRVRQADIHGERPCALLRPVTQSGCRLASVITQPSADCTLYTPRPSGGNLKSPFASVRVSATTVRLLSVAPAACQDWLWLIPREKPAAKRTGDSLRLLGDDDAFCAEIRRRARQDRYRQTPRDALFHCFPVVSSVC